MTSGVETSSTGPLGQGIATSVGMAIAADWLARHFNRPDFALFDYDVFALCGDGCMMEGVGSEAAFPVASAIWGSATSCWDLRQQPHHDRGGNTAPAFSEDVAGRLFAYGWHVQRVSDANNRERVADAITVAKAGSTTGRALIIVEGYATSASRRAAYKQDTSGAHGEPLGELRCGFAKRNYWLARGRDNSSCPIGVYEHTLPRTFRRSREASSRTNALALFERYRSAHPELADQ